MSYREKLKMAAAAARAGLQEGAALNAAHDPTASLALHGAAGLVSYGFEKPPKLPDRIEEPHEWERAMLADRAARDAARAPYLAAERLPLLISRVATRGETQAREMAAHLGTSGLAARPDLMYGLYRVPDRIRPSAGRERGRVVEWDVVHAATHELPPADAPTDVFFEADRPWVGRRPGDPALLDEDLALAYLLRAGIGPEQTLGIARHVTIDPQDKAGEDGSRYLLARVEGVHVFHPQGLGDAVTGAWAADAPLAVRSPPPPGIHLEVLRWEPVARVVHPVRQHRPRLPSAFPHLPLTPQELLRAYLEIVGVAPQDSYGVQVTYHEPFDLMGRTSEARILNVRTTWGGDELPCADGKRRVRMHGGQHVVVTYRDDPRYAAGRERWKAYEEEVLLSSLAQGPELRPPVPKPDGRLERSVDRMIDVVHFFSGEPTGGGAPPPRYCWPPLR